MFSMSEISSSRSSGMSRNDNRNVVDFGQFGRTPAPLPSDNLVAVANFADYQGLDDAGGPNGIRRVR